MSKSRGRPSIRFVISAPSGAGKTTLATELLDRVDGLIRTVSCTTRPPRPGEQDGVDYSFVKPEGFAERVAAGAFLEWAEVHGHRYGTPQAEVERIAAAGADAVLVIDVQGAAAVKEALRDAVTVFVLPPSRQELVNRLRGRAGERPGLDEVLERRLGVAAHEIARYVGYDYVIINDELESAVASLTAIVRAERCRRDRQAPLAEEILDSFRRADDPDKGPAPADATREDRT